MNCSGIFYSPFDKSIKSYRSLKTCYNDYIEISSFSGTDKFIIYRCDSDFSFDNIFFNKDSKEIDNENLYNKWFEESLKKLKNNDFQKVVLFSEKIVPNKGLDCKETYYNLIQKYPNCMCFAFKTENEYWMGATPELVGRYKDDMFHTISLAGTVKVNNSFGKKERIEQDIVTKYIKNILNLNDCYQIEIEESELIFNNIKHIVSKINTKVSSKFDFDKIIDIINPSPAICGLPKKVTKEYLNKYNMIERGFFTGLAKIYSTEECFAFNLIRCFQINKNYLKLYAGGGIIDISDNALEWKELQNKFYSIESLFK